MILPQTAQTVIQVILLGILGLITTLFLLAALAGAVVESVNLFHRLWRGRYPTSRHARAKGRWSH